MNEKRKKNDNCKNINLTNNTPILISNPDKENINITLNYKDEKGRKLTFANLSVNNNSKGCPFNSKFKSYFKNKSICE